MADLQISDLLESELRDLESQGRIKDGKILPIVAPATPATAKSAEPVSTETIMPVGVKERMEAIKKVESSFSATLPKIEKGKIVEEKLASKDGGVAARQIQEENPDWATKPKEDPVEASDKIAFLAHIMGAAFFSKEYELFGGALVVTFRTVPQSHLDQCIQQAWSDDKLDGPIQTKNPNDVSMVYLTRFRNYKFTAELYSIKKSQQLQRLYKAFDTASALEAGVRPVRQAWIDLQAEFSSPVMTAIRAAHDKFENLVNRLTVQADRPDFWKADSGT